MTALALATFFALATECVPNHAQLSAVELYHQARTLAAVARHESRFEPLTILDNSETKPHSVVFQDLPTAIAVTRALIEQRHSVDVGVMQINSRNFANLGLSVVAAFNPCASIGAGLTVLLNGYEGGSTHREEQAALRRALSIYNTGTPGRGFINGYVQKVVAGARFIPPIDAPSYSSVPTEGGANVPPPPSPPRIDLRQADSAGLVPDQADGPEDALQPSPRK